jgi:hypothetical protein
MAVQLFSHLSYADRAAFMDSQRKVLLCHAEGCDAREPWVDITDAVLKGWAFEDRPSSGSVVRYWFCPAHKPPENYPPLKTYLDFRRAVASPELSPEAAKLAFGGRRIVVLQLGANNGTQIAVVLKDETFGVYGIQVTGWRASSECWTNPKLVGPSKVVGAPSPRDKRISQAAKAWPPPWMKNQRK